MVASNFETVMDHVFRYEGGYSDHPADPGGATQMGITIGVLAEFRGKPVTKAEVKAISKEEAREIYRKRYWDVICGDELPAGVDLVTMDSAVNSGPSRGAKWLQRAIGSEADGKVGIKTLAAAETADAVTTIERMCDDRMNFLRGLKTWGSFGKGWSRRVEDVRAAARELAADGGNAAIVIPSAPAPAPTTPTAPLPANPSPTPVEQSSKSVGAGKWTAIVGTVWTTISAFLMSTPSVPEQYRDPVLLAGIGTLLTTLASIIGAYVAPQNAVPTPAP